MKILVISDIHGMIFWKEALLRARPEDVVIFLGDYFDLRGDGPHAESQTGNFLEICDLARGNPKIHLLLGNHDLQYTDFATAPTASFDIRYAWEFKKALMENMDLLKIVHIERERPKPLIFSHAGVSQNFLDACQIASVDDINGQFRKFPGKFEFITSHDGEIADIYGDNVWQGPLWIRPYSLLEGAVAGYDQVLGHTPVAEIEEGESAHGDSIYFTCTFNDNCLELQQE